MPFASLSDVSTLLISMAGGVLALAVVAAVWRLWRGPTSWDRILAFDLLGGIALAAMVWLAVKLERPVLLDAALIMALVAFIGTVVLARWREDRGGDES